MTDDYVTEIRHIVNEKVGEDDEGNPVLEPVNKVEYEFTDVPSSEAKQAVRDHVPHLLNKDKIRQIIESIDG